MVAVAVGGWRRRRKKTKKHLPGKELNFSCLLKMEKEGHKREVGRLNIVAKGNYHINICMSIANKTRASHWGGKTLPTHHTI